MSSHQESAVHPAKGDNQPNLAFRDRDTTIVCGANAPYFGLLAGLVQSIKRDPTASQLALSVLDLGLAPDQIEWLRAVGAEVKEPGWDVDWPGRELFPGWFRAMTARPYLPRHFPGYRTYLWLDCDAWVQDGSVLTYFIRGARRGNLAIVPEIDRSYFTHYKRGKLFGWDQNHKVTAYAFGYRTAYRLGRYPILNSGVFALDNDAPHWQHWREALHEALNRKRLRGGTVKDMNVKIIEQTSLNVAVFREWKSGHLPVTMLPAYCNWFCGKSTPMLHKPSGLLVEPNEPYQALGIVHMAGDGVQERVFDLPTTDGDRVASMLTWDEIQKLQPGYQPPPLPADAGVDAAPDPAAGATPASASPTKAE